MRKPIAAVLIATSVFSLSVAADAKPRLAPEAKLAKMLDGRVAGEPQNCIYLPTIRSTRIIDKTAIIYDAGRTLWVNRPRSGAESLNDDDILLHQVRGDQNHL